MTPAPDPETSSPDTVAPLPVGQTDQASAQEPGLETSASLPPTMPVMPQVRTFPLSFTGNTGEFFRIWIVNVALSVVTLGFYTPWARIRTRQYFYGNTWVDGHNFEYNANPWALLRGYLLVAAFFGAYNAAVQFQFSGWEWVAGLVGVLFIGTYPWLIRQSLRFLARSTFHRGMNFRFLGSLGGAYVNYGVINIAAALFFPALPWAWFRQRQYQVEHLHYGQAKGHFRGDMGAFYLIGLKGLGLSVGGLILLLVLGGLAAILLPNLNLSDVESLDEVGPALLAALGLAYFVIILLYVSGWQYLRAEIMRYVLNQVELGGVVRLGATFNSWRLVWINLTNTVAQVFTLGLLTPWAAVRRTNYIISHIQVRTITDLDSFTAEAGSAESALGEAATELLDINLGF